MFTHLLLFFQCSLIISVVEPDLIVLMITNLIYRTIVYIFGILSGKQMSILHA